MLILLSPAKTLDFNPTDVELATQPRMLDQSEMLVRQMRRYAPRTIQKLMGVSEQIAALNVARFRDFAPPFNLNNAKQALLAFKGESYRDLELEEFSETDFSYAQDHLRVLSGLYGVLRPLDLIQPYRLEMGLRLKTRRGKHLYAFWGKRITDQLNQDLEDTGNKLVLNLASNEYFKSVQTAHLKAHVIQPIFKDLKNGAYKIISFFAKRARGAMTSYVLRERIATLEGLRAFTGNGYRYDSAGSTDDKLLFLRDSETTNASEPVP